MDKSYNSKWFYAKKSVDRIRFSTKCWYKGISDGIDPESMPFLTLYSERKILSGLGYISSINELDCYTATALVNIKAEINKQETEDRKKDSKKGVKRGR